MEVKITLDFKPVYNKLRRYVPHRPHVVPDLFKTDLKRSLRFPILIVYYFFLVLVFWRFIGHINKSPGTFVNLGLPY